MDGAILGKGNFARVELACHEITSVQVSASFMYIVHDTLCYGT